MLNKNVSSSVKNNEGIWIPIFSLKIFKKIINPRKTVQPCGGLKENQRDS